MGARRFEYSAASSNKFWEVWVERNTVKTRYGKIGADGQTSARKTPGPLEADELLDKLVREKLRKGYVEKRAGGAPAKPAWSAKPSKSAAAPKPAKPAYRGKRFVDEDLSYQDLRKADLSDSRWRGCSFDGADLKGANLSGATFEDCTFDGTELDEVRARGATFEGCALSVEIRSADLRQARFLALAADCAIDFSWSKAQGMTMEVTMTEPARANWISGADADVRGATITFALADGAKAAKRAKTAKKGKEDWYRGLEAEVKADAKTRITYASPAGARAPEPPSRSPSLSTGGAAGEPIGSLHAQSAGLWLLAVDAAAASAWRGDDGFDYDDDDGVVLAEDRKNDKSDFGRALYVATRRSGVIAVGAREGVIATVGGGGWSHLWRIPNGVALLDYAPGDDVDERAKSTLARLSLAVTQLPTKGKPKHVGAVKVASGALALLLPAEKGSFRKELLAKAAKAAKAVAANPSRVLVPLANGTYDVFEDTLSFDDEDFGSIDRRVRIVRAGA